MPPVKSHIAQSLEPKRLKDALTIVRLASLAPNADALRKNVLDKLCHNLRIDKGIFILPSDNGQFTDFWGKNTEDKYHEQFKAHFYKYDPFSLIPGHMQRKCVVCLDELVSYPTFLKSAYYNDFLRPQDIYHKAIVYLKSRGVLQGMIALFRPRHAEGFSNEDSSQLRMVAPYIAHALENMELLKRIGLHDNILRAVEACVCKGLLVLDDSLHVLYANDEAREACSRLTGSAKPRETAFSLPYELLQDCLALRQETIIASDGFPPLPRHRILKGIGSDRFSVQSQVLPQREECRGSILFMISMEKLAEHRPGLGTVGREQLRLAYRLSGRESEIVSYVCEGLRNSEIAERLFISEITVKKHVQNIFHKMGVQSRSALIHKVLTSSLS